MLERKNVDDELRLIRKQKEALETSEDNNFDYFDSLWDELNKGPQRKLPRASTQLNRMEKALSESNVDQLERLYSKLPSVGSQLSHHASLNCQSSAAIPLSDKDAAIQELEKSSFDPFSHIDSKNDYFTLKSD